MGRERRIEVWEFARVLHEGGYVGEEVCCQERSVLEVSTTGRVGYEGQVERRDDMWEPHCRSLGSWGSMGGLSGDNINSGPSSVLNIVGLY